ncbi:MAG: pyridoxal-dependent decarboxylase [Nannocystaceae bacterium]
MPSDPPSPSETEPSLQALPGLAASIFAEVLQRDEAEPMRPYRDADSLRSDLPLSIDGEPLPWPQTLQLLRDVLAATPSTTSRRFFNQLFGGRDPVASLAELSTVLLNSPMHTFKASGVQVLIEREVLRRMAQRAGMPDGDGAITPGGSLSNLMGMLMARNEALSGARERGLPAAPARIYTSAASHYSVRKAAGILGLGRDSVRRVPIDHGGRMRPDALAEMIEQDRAAAAVPVMINATSATTVLGAFDPLDAIADVAERAGVWLHVDAAYGGSVLLSERHRHLLRGCERADSLTWDAHKLLGVPLTCSALLTRRPGLCARHLDEPAGYLFQEDALFDPGRGSLQCARRNDALKLWLTWKHRGDVGLGARIDRLFELAAHAAARIEAEPRLRLVRPPASINVCFEVLGVPARTLCRELWERGIAKIGHASVDDREIVRWVFVNPQVEPADIDEVLDELLTLAEHLRR